MEPRLPPQAKEHARSRSRLFEGELGASGEPPPAPRAAHRIAHSTSPAAWITASPRLAACSPSHHRLERVPGLASASRAAPVASRARATPRARPPTAPRSRGMGPEQVVWMPICDSQGGRGRCVRRPREVGGAWDARPTRKLSPRCAGAGAAGVVLLFENWLIVVRHSSGTARTEALLAAFTRRRVDRDRRGDALAHARRRRAALVWVVLAAALKQDAARCGASLFLLSPVVVLVSRLLFGRRFVRDGSSPACIAAGCGCCSVCGNSRVGLFLAPGRRASRKSRGGSEEPPVFPGSSSW